MVLWIVTPLLLVAFFLALRRLVNGAQDYTATIYGWVRSDRLASPSS